MSFYDRKEVRDILAYFKLLVSPSDEVSLLRIIDKPARGIGQKAIELLLERAVSSGRALWEVLAEADQIAGLAPTAVAAVARFRGLVEDFRGRLERDPLVSVARDLIQRTNYRAEIERLYKEPNDQTARWNTVEEVINAVGAYQKRAEQPTLGGFLDDVALAGRDEPSDKETKLKRNNIVLMTLHSAKGLEFPHVYLVGMEEGLLPHHRAVTADGSAIDEERRLCYVGVTRAQDRLTMTLALSRLKWGKSRSTIPSRFLFELLGKADNARAAGPRAAVPSGATTPPRPAGRPASTAKAKLAGKNRGRRTK